jgi:SAM-dependent methyltransferase
MLGTPHPAMPSTSPDSPAAPAPPTPALLLDLGRWLQSRAYVFTTVTPLTHQRVLARHRALHDADERDAFGWSLPFAPTLLPCALGQRLLQAGVVVAADESGSAWRSTVRWSTLGGLLLSHSAYPTTASDAVFFGPDTYRFASLITEALRLAPLPRGAHILDMGCGSGAGGLIAAAQEPSSAPAAIVLADINPRALAHAQANALLAGVPQVQCVQTDLYAGIDGTYDLIVANPPYLVDGASRAYRHGGGPLGGELSERIVRDGLAFLRPGGRLVLYTGSAMVRGRDPLRESLTAIVRERDWPMAYGELDPDVFGEELDTPAYACTERIAAVGMVVQRPAA